MLFTNQNPYLFGFLRRERLILRDLRRYDYLSPLDLFYRYLRKTSNAWIVGARGI